MIYIIIITSHYMLIKAERCTGARGPITRATSPLGSTLLMSRNFASDSEISPPFSP